MDASISSSGEKMADTLKTFLARIQAILKSESRPTSALRQYFRKSKDLPLDGQIIVATQNRTAGYTPLRELRDGMTVRALIPNTEYSLEIQIRNDIVTTVGQELQLTFLLKRFDPSSKTFYGYQLSATESIDVPQEGSDTADGQTQESTQENRTSKKEAAIEDDPLAAYQAEAIALLSTPQNDNAANTTTEHDLLDQLQRDAEQNLIALQQEVDNSVQTNLQQSNAEQDAAALPPDEPKITPPPAPPSKPDHADPLNSEPQQPLPSVKPTAPPPSNPKDSNDNTPPTQVTSAPEAVAPESEHLSDSISSKEKEVAGLDSLLADVFKDSETPITVELLSAIVSRQTGLPHDAVTDIQKAMWTQLSTPRSFGEGSSSYSFPLLGTFTIRKHKDDVSLDFKSTNVHTIAQAKVNDGVTFHEARAYEQSNSGPLIARHTLKLAISTAAALGLKQATTYLAVYRTILLMLQIFGKGERRIRIEDVGEFFPATVKGGMAYRFRAYPTLLRQTSSAFKDAAAFLSNKGEAQQRFEHVSTEIPTQETDGSLKGCLVIIAICLGIGLLNYLVRNY